MITEIPFPMDVVAGEGAIRQLPSLVAPLGNKVVLVTNRNQFSDSDQLDQIHRSLLDRHINVLMFDDINPASDSKTVDKVVEMARSARCDVVIGMGGDIALNIAKAVSLLCSNDGECSDYLIEEDGYRLAISHPPHPVLMVPTYFGTLCESTCGFIVSDHRDRIKKKLYNKKIRPLICILDPNVIPDFSQRILSASGILLMAYAIDTMVSLRSTPFSQIFSQKAIEIISQTLPRLVKDTKDTHLRNQMFMSSLMVSYAAGSGSLGGLFALCEAMTSLRSIYKGVVASLLLPRFMEYNLTSSSSQYVPIARIFRKNVSQISVLEAGLDAVEQIRLFIDDFHISDSFKSINFDRNMVSGIMKIFNRFEESRYTPRSFSEQDLASIIE